jgi:hypothetical protein
MSWQVVQKYHKKTNASNSSLKAVTDMGKIYSELVKRYRL